MLLQSVAKGMYGQIFHPWLPDILSSPVWVNERRCVCATNVRAHRASTGIRLGTLWATFQCNAIICGQLKPPE